MRSDESDDSDESDKSDKGDKSDKSDVSIIAAVLLKTSIELYTIALKENSDIERLITEEAVPSIPKLRDSMERMVKPTLH